MIESLLIGASIGYIASKLNIKTEVILSAGLVGGALLGSLSVPLGVGILGACVITGIKELLTTTATETTKTEKTELEEIEELFKNVTPNNSVVEITRVLITEPPKEKTEEIKKEVKGTFISHLSTLITLAPILILINTIPGLSSFIYPISIITIVIAAWISLSNNNALTNIKNILGLSVVGSLALYTLLNISSGGSFLYFLALISIPSLLFKDKTNNNNKTDNSLFNIKNNFMYGNSGATLPIIGGAIALLQTIIMGSGQDMLGTLINNDYSILLDPYRLAILSGVIGITTIFGTSLLNKTNKLTNTNNFSIVNNIVKISMIATSTVVIATQFNPIVGIAAVCAGITAKLLLKNNTNKIAIAALLIVGGLTNI
jgi:hypothetical protein